MSQPRYLPAAVRALADIYDYTLDRFGEAQADQYVSGLFAHCETLTTRSKQPIPDAFDVEGFFSRYEQHMVYWRLSPVDEVVVVCILHGRMDLPNRLLDAEAENNQL